MNTITKMHIRKFRHWARANSAVNHSIKSAVIICGDDMRYWVVSPRDGAKLEKLGYEWAQ